MLKKIALFTSSVKKDYRLAEYDIRQSTAHARALGAAGIISRADSEKLISELAKLRAKMAKDEKFFSGDYDDVHMALEEKLGEIGKKLHAGRSRNDQVACDMRMYIRDSIKRITGKLELAIEAFRLKDLETGGKNVFMPAYTHMQKAQAVDLSTYLDVFRKWFARDVDRLNELHKRVNLMPLGAAAGAATNIKLDRKAVAQELGFDGLLENPMDAVSSRDYIQELANDLAVLGTHFSRMAEDFIIFSTREFGFIELDEAIADTSSIMPQKKNPDCLELIRSACAGLISTSVSISVMMKGLPLVYNRDMQNDKEIFAACETAETIADLVPDILANISFNTGRMCAAASDGFIEAADFAEYLVLKGVDFRTAHQKTGQLVNAGIEKGYCSLKEFTLEEMKKLIPEAEMDVFDFIDIYKATGRRLYDRK